MPPIGFIDDDDEHLGVQGFRLPSLPMLRGRNGVAVPTGVILPEAKGGVPPYTYSVEDLPGGASFTAATRALGGTPNAAGDNTVTYKAEDSSTPALEVSKTFGWPILDVLSTDPIMLQDFDGGKVGYGVSDFVFAYAATLVSGEDLGFNNEAIWQSAPRTVKGSVVDDPFEVRLLPTGGVISRIDYRPGDNPDRLRLFDSDQDLAENPVDSDIGAWASDDDNDSLSLYLQTSHLTVGVQLDFDDDLQSSGNWHATFRLTSTQSTWIRSNLNDGNEFLIVIA